MWFLGWVPQSVGAMVGACIGLFLLSLLERWLAALRSVMEVHWDARWVLSTMILPLRLREGQGKGNAIQAWIDTLA